MDVFIDSTLIDLKKRHVKEKGLRNRIVLEKAIHALEEYQQLTAKEF